MSSIYTAPQSETTQLQATTADGLNVQLAGWEAVQVIVDNPTSRWLYLPQAKRFIAPGQLGAVIPIPSNTWVQATWQAPAGYTQPAPTAGQVAVLIWLSAGIEAVPSAGIAQTPAVSIQSGTVDIGNISGPVTISGNVPVQNATGTLLGTQQPQTLLTPAAGVSVPRDGANHTLGTYVLPPGTHAIAVVSIPSAVRPTQINLVGSRTGLDWAQFPTLGNQAPNAFLFKVLEAIDPSVTVKITLDTLAGQSGTVWVAAVLDTMMVTPDGAQAGIQTLMQPPTGIQPAPITIKSESGVNFDGRMAVALTDAVPAPWQAAQSSAVAGNVSLGVGAVQSLVAGVAGQRVYCHSLLICVQATGPGILAALQGTNVTPTQLGALMLLAGYLLLPLNGKPTAAGEGVEIAQQDTRGATGNFSATLVYTQQ